MSGKDISGQYAVVSSGIGLGRGKTSAFYRFDMYDRALTGKLCLAEHTFKLGGVVTVNRTYIVKSHVFKIVRMIHRVFQSLLCTLHCAEYRLADERYAVETVACGTFRAVIAAGGPHFLQMLCKTAYVFRYRHLVFVEDDDQSERFVRVVQRLVYKSAGERTVAHYGNRVRIVARERLCACDAYRRRKRG